MTNYWYVARNNEILIDMDKPKTSLPHVERRIRGAVDSEFLKIVRVEAHQSFSPSHLHMLITLTEYIDPVERAVWAIMFHSDTYRACNTLMRVQNMVDCPDLVITPIKFQRESDICCFCDNKHVGHVMDKCVAAIALRGENRTRSFFGRPITADPKNRVFPQNGNLRIFDSNVVWTGQHFS